MKEVASGRAAANWIAWEARRRRHQRTGRSSACAVQPVAARMVYHRAEGWGGGAGGAVEGMLLCRAETTASGEAVALLTPSAGTPATVLGAASSVISNTQGRLGPSYRPRTRLFKQAVEIIVVESREWCNER